MFVDGLHSCSLDFHYPPRCSVINFNFLDLKILLVLFQVHEGKETRKRCSVRLAMADRGCICCDRMVMCRTRCAVFLSYEKSQLRLHSTFTNVNVPVR